MKSNRYLKFILYPAISAIFITTHCRSFAQTVPAAGVTITAAIPASPDAAALGKYGDIPVSPYTGVPDISIPIYNIKSGDLSLPISISYHSGGNKIEEMASSVGLGWTLNAGGAITRSIRGKADETAFGYLNQTSAATINTMLPQTQNLTTAQKQTLDFLLNETADGTLDSEPDVYSYNFAGYSGKFVMDGTGNVYVMPLQDIKFTFAVGSYMINSFTAQTPDGVRYYFGNSGATEYTNPSGSNAQSAVSWFLTKIVSPTGHEIDFSYNPEAYDMTTAPSQTLFNATGGGQPPPNGQGPVNVQPQSATSAFNNVKLSSITFENGSVYVSAINARLDLNSIKSSTGAKEIDQISVNSTGLTKTFNFYYLNQANSRLRLDSMIEIVPNVSGNSNGREKYSFVYNTDPWNGNGAQLFSQDWWGYYNSKGNGINNLGVLVPQDMDYYDSVNGSTYVLAGANRAPDETSMMGGMLTQINYPTGGYSKFKYEANEEYNLNLQGTSPKYPTMVSQVALSNDPGSIYYNYDANNGNSGNTFTIATTGASAPVTVSGGGLDGAGGPPNDFIQGRIYQGTTQSTIAYVFTNTSDTTIYLAPGTYNINILDNKNQAYNPTSNPNGIKYFLQLSYSGYTQATVNAMIHNYIAGGLRIRQIADYDGVSSNAINLRAYTYLLNGNVSSGYIDFQPDFEYPLGIESYTTDGNLGINTVADYVARTSNSNYPFSSSGGSVVSYSHVEELYGSAGQNGMNEYFYTNSASNPDLQNGMAVFPFPPATDQEWHRGLLQKETQWKQAGNGTYIKVNETAKAYSTINLNTNGSVGIKVGFNPKPPASTYNSGNSYFCAPNSAEFARVVPTSYFNYTDYTFMSSDTTRTYNPANNSQFVQTWSNYQFDPVTYQLTRLQSLDSKNELITQSVTYAGNTSLSVAGVSNLVSSGIETYPIEEVTQKSNTDGTNARTVKAVLTSYKPTVPFRDSVFELNSYIPLTNFTPLTAGGSRDSRYQPYVAFNTYDAVGNILQEQKVSDALHYFIWGYVNQSTPGNNTYPIAEVINAGAADAAYTNFEGSTANPGSWVFSTASVATDATAPMGSACFMVSSSNSITRSGLTAGTTYVVSFWSKSGATITVTGGTVSNISTGTAKSGWYYHEYKVTAASAVTIGGSGAIDELRLYPSNAQMSTYTYTPLVGIASKCDTKNDITYYNYDSAGRLSYIQDQNRNIIKSYNYNYNSAAQ